MDISISEKCHSSRPRSAVLQSAVVVAIAGILILLSACGDRNDTVPSDDPSDPSDPGELTQAQQDALPDDCVLALRPGAEVYCYSPQSASLLALQRDGSLLWEQPIAGDTNDSRVSAVSIMGEPILLTRSTIDDEGMWRHALQGYLRDGTPDGSVPILTPFQELVNGGLTSSGWNLAGEPLRVASNAQSVFIVASPYIRTSASRDSRPGDWAASGTEALMRIDPASGKRLAYRRLDTSVSSAPQILASGDVRLSIDESTRTFDAMTLADTAEPDEGLVLRSGNVPLLMPQLYAWANGTRLDRFVQGVTAVLSESGETASPADPPCLAAAGENEPGCTGQITTGPVTTACPLSGTATHTFHKSIAYIGNEGVRLTDTWHSVLFDDCRVELIGYAQLADGEYTVAGMYRTNIPAPREENFQHTYEALSLLWPDANVDTVTGSIHDVTYSGSHYNHTRTVAVSNASSQDEGVSDLTVETFDAATHGGYTNRVQGTLIWFGALSDGMTIDVTIQPPLYAHWPSTIPGTGTPDGSRITMSGDLALTAADGSALTISVEENPSVSGSYVLRYDLHGEGRLYDAPYESLLMPFF